MLRTRRSKRAKRQGVLHYAFIHLGLMRSRSLTRPHGVVSACRLAQASSLHGLYSPRCGNNLSSLVDFFFFYWSSLAARCPFFAPPDYKPPSLVHDRFAPHPCLHRFCFFIPRQFQTPRRRPPRNRLTFFSSNTVLSLLRHQGSRNRKITIIH